MCAWVCVWWGWGGDALVLEGEGEVAELVDRDRPEVEIVVRRAHLRRRTQPHSKRLPARSDPPVCHLFGCAFTCAAHNHRRAQRDGATLSNRPAVPSLWSRFAGSGWRASPPPPSAPPPATAEQRARKSPVAVRPGRRGGLPAPGRPGPVSVLAYSCSRGCCSPQGWRRKAGAHLAGLLDVDQRRHRDLLHLPPRVSQLRKLCLCGDGPL